VKEGQDEKGKERAEGSGKMVEKDKETLSWGPGAGNEGEMAKEEGGKSKAKSGGGKRRTNDGDGEG